MLEANKVSSNSMNFLKTSFEEGTRNEKVRLIFFVSENSEQESLAINNPSTEAMKLDINEFSSQDIDEFQKECRTKECKSILSMNYDGQYLSFLTTKLANQATKYLLQNDRVTSLCAGNGKFVSLFSNGNVILYTCLNDCLNIKKI